MASLDDIGRLPTEATPVWMEHFPHLHPVVHAIDATLDHADMAGVEVGTDFVIRVMTLDAQFYNVEIWRSAEQ